MSHIRVGYSGLIAFVGGFMGILLNLFFTLMITRRLTPEDFGIFSLLFSIINYFIISEVVISYWATRQIARGEEIGKTGVISSFVLSGINIPLFILYVFFISQNNNIPFEILLFGVILIPVMFLSQTLTGINLGYRPHTTSYSLIFFSIFKIPLALITVVILDWGILGIILAILIATTGKVFIQLYFASQKLKTVFNFSVFIRWLRLSWVPLFAHFQNYIQLLDVVLYSIIVNSVIGVAYYNAAFAIAHIVSQAGSISQALYPKLLANRNFDGITENLKLVFYFAIPLVAISIIFAKPALFALNPVYQDAWPVIIFLTLKLFLQVTRVVPLSIIGGTEIIDKENKPQFSKMIKSNLFRLPVFLSIYNIIYVGILVTILFTFNSMTNEFELVLWWAFIGFMIEIPITIHIWHLSRKTIKLSLPWKKIFKSFFASIMFVIVYLATSDYVLNYDISIYKFLPSLIIQLGICISIYVVITFVIDKEVKTLLRSIINKIQ